MKWSMLWDLSVHNMSIPFDRTCCLCKSELETCLRFPVSENRNRKLRSESSFLFPLSFNGSIRCSPRPSTQTAHQLVWTACIESSCSCFSLLVGFFEFILTLGISASKGSFVSQFDICTRFPNWFDVITNWCYSSTQSFRWTYERTALPSPFPHC